MTFGELFAGIGGFSLGLERAGMKCKWQVEIDPYATAVLKKHWPDVPRHDDVRTFPPQGDFSVDLICGGFPCQDLSVAGKGAGLKGSRSGLWSEFARIIRTVQPRWVVIENVAALTSRGLGTVLGDLAEIGLDAEWHCIPASAVGAPHRRERIWIVGQSRCQPTGSCVNSSAAERSQAPPPSRPVVASNSGRCGTRSRESNVANSQRIRRAPKSDCVQHSQASTDRHADITGSCRQVPPDTSSPRLSEQRRAKPIQEEQPAVERSSWWLSEPNVGRVAYGIPSRVDRLRCLGNAVVPQVVEVIGRAIMQAEGLQ